MGPTVKGPLLFTILLALSQPANAVTPDALIAWCTERELADKYPEDATASYHTEAILGYLTAVLDSLHEDNPVCHYRITGREFCGTFRSFMKRQAAAGETSFNHARAAIAENYECSEKATPTSGTGAR
jgi:hypothetical protein